MLLLLEEALGVERGHRARAGGGDCLAVGVILHVACGEDARDVRPRRACLGDEVALLVVVEPVQEERGGRVVADRDEDAVGLEDSRLARLRVLDPDAGHVPFGLAEHLLDDGVQNELDLLVRARRDRP